MMLMVILKSFCILVVFSAVIVTSYAVAQAIFPSTWRQR